MKSPVNPDIEMKKMILPYGGIEIEYCPVSGGVWLDKGELEKLVEVVEDKAKSKYAEISLDDNMPFGGSKNSQANRYSSNDDEDYYSRNGSNHQPKKKRESILGEIFDIF